MSNMFVRRMFAGGEDGNDDRSDGSRHSDTDVLLFKGTTLDADHKLLGRHSDGSLNGYPEGVDVEPGERVSPVQPGKHETLRLIGTIIKSFIGSGVLFLAKAFSNGGWAFSISSMIIMAAITGFCIMRLIACREKVVGSYSYVAQKAVGPWGRIAVDISLVLSQTGFCCVYIIFIAQNVLQLLNARECWLGGEWLWVLILLELPLFAPLTWIRNIASFGPTNILADLLIGGGLLGILIYCGVGMVSEASAGVSITLPAFDSSNFSLMLGTAVYAFEGVGMILPVVESLSPATQKRFPRLLGITLAGITLVYCIVGLMPYLYFTGMKRTTLADSATLDLPRVWWAFLIQAGYCLALVFSYPLMMFPAMQICERAVTPYLGLLPHGETKWRKNAFRTFVVSITLVIAYVGSEQLNNFVSLVGCFACTPLAFMWPSLCHLKLRPEASRASKAADIAIILFGVAVFVFSTYISIATWSISTINPCVTTATS